MRPLPKRLLFVDDEPNIRAMLPLILRRYGFTVTVAATVAQAVRCIETKEFDLLTSDLNIEGEATGYEVVRAMRKICPDCVIIVLTGYPAVETAAEGFKLGIDDYLSKPTDVNALVANLAEKLAARRPGLKYEAAKPAERRKPDQRSNPAIHTRPHS
jgi:DNA-binding response OmpR family regulator